MDFSFFYLTGQVFGSIDNPRSDLHGTGLNRHGTVRMGRPAKSGYHQLIQGGVPPVMFVGL